MEVPSIWFFPIFSSISILFLRIGFQAFDKATISYSDKVITNLIKTCIAFSVFYSSTYSFFCRPWLENKKQDTHFCYGRGAAETLVSFLCSNIFLFLYSDVFPQWFMVLASLWLLILVYTPFLSRSLSTSQNRPILTSIRMYRCHNICGALSISVFLKVGYKVSTCPIYCVVIFGSLIVVSYAAIFLRMLPSFKKWFASVQTGQLNRVVYIMYEKRKIIEWGVGTLSSIFYQYYFRKTTVDLMLAFLCFAVSWLCNLAMVQPSTDFGIFNFLISNSVISSAVNLFGVGIYTWLVLCGCGVLIALRMKIESVVLVYMTHFISN